MMVTSPDHPGCVLLGSRLGDAPGTNKWALLVGTEFGESIEAAAERELLEETGLKPAWVTRVIFWENAIMDSYHYVVPFVLCNIKAGEEPIQGLEPKM